VIEFGHGANGTPTCGGMTVLARNGQGTVRTARGLFLGLRSLLGNTGRNESGRTGVAGTAEGRKSKQRPERELEQCSRSSLPTGRRTSSRESIKNAASVNNLRGAYNCTRVQSWDSVLVLVTLLYSYTYKTSVVSAP
jgi:hypothetical protein